MNWEPDFLRAEATIEAVSANHPIYDKRLNDWRKYYEKYKILPSALLTEDGWMVNGHHRLIVAREKGIRLHGSIVEQDGEKWIVTGNLCLVK